MFKILFTLLFSVILLYPSYTAHAITVKAEDISNRAYYPAVLKSIHEAQESITVAMYAVFFHDYGESHTRELINALINARNRGVEVRVYLNYDNRAARQMLHENNIAVFLIDKQIKLHAKLVVIDSHIVITGSSNWTDNALDKNIESNCLITSNEFAAQQIPFFDNLAKHVVAIEEKPIKAVDIPVNLLLDPALGPRMIADSDIRPFQFYLWLLKNTRDNTITVNYLKAATDLGIPMSNYRQQLRLFAEKLKTKYGLIDYSVDKKKGFSVTIQRKNDEKYFPLNIQYYEYNLAKELILREQFAYLAAVYEQSQTTKQYWQMGQEELAKKYHIDNVLFGYGFKHLKELNLIERIPGRAESGQYIGRPFNKYRVKPLVSPKVTAARFRQMEKSYGKDAVALAREYAAIFDEQNNPAAAKSILRLMGEYPAKAVKEAAARMAKYGDENPLKNIGYFEGIIKNVSTE